MTVEVALRCGRRRPEVGHEDLLPVCRAEDVLRLKIAVVHLLLVTPMDRVENLHEDGPDALVAARECDALRDEVEEVAIAVVRDEVEMTLVLVDFAQGVDARDVRDERLDLELAPLVLRVVCRRAILLDDFDGTAGGPGGDRGVVVDGEVDRAVGASTDGLEQLETPSVNRHASEVGKYSSRHRE